MSWNLTEALEYYRRQGVPADQNAIISLLAEILQEHGGSISGKSKPQTSPLTEIAADLGMRNFCPLVPF